MFLIKSGFKLIKVLNSPVPVVRVRSPPLISISCLPDFSKDYCVDFLEYFCIAFGKYSSRRSRIFSAFVELFLEEKCHANEERLKFQITKVFIRAYLSFLHWIFLILLIVFTVLPVFFPKFR